MWLARQYLQSLSTWLLAGKRTRIYSINLMRAQHPAWFKEDLERLFGLLATGAIRPRVAERISFDQVGEQGRRPLCRRGEGGQHDRGGEEGPDNRWGERGHRYGPFAGEKNACEKVPRK